MMLSSSTRAAGRMATAMTIRRSFVGTARFFVREQRLLPTGFRRLSSEGGNNNNNNNSNPSSNRGRRGGGYTRRERSQNRNKPNFSDQFLQPAARGELKHHRSGVPKSLGRRPKGHGVRGADPLTDEDDDFYLNAEEDDIMTGSVRGLESRSNRKSMESRKGKTGTMADLSKVDDLNPKEYAEVMEFLDVYRSIGQLQDVEEYYWNESDYEGTAAIRLKESKQDKLDKLRSEATRDADGNLVIEVDDETFAMFEDSSTAKGKELASRDQPRQRANDGDNFGFEFVLDSFGIAGSDTPPIPAEYDVVKPLKLKGPTWTDFVESMLEHPTKFGQLTYTSPHAESTREPLPDCPPRRLNPNADFVDAHGRFIYVWGLPALLAVGGDAEAQPVDISNPVHEFEIQSAVAKLFDVTPESVCVSSNTSAFVGFPSRMEQRIALEIGPGQNSLPSPVSISKYTPRDGDKKSFGDEFKDRVVRLDNLPDGLNPSLISTSLFPSSTEVGAVYGGFSADDVVMLSPNSAVICLESSELAESATSSSAVRERLIDIGQHRIRYNKARRNLVYTGNRIGPGGSIMERELGHDLIVDGDMPRKNFYLSHATAIHLRNLDPSVSKEEISAVFQPFCAMPRDVNGSVEFVTCYQGLPTGRAYVGFDDHNECEAALQALLSGGRIESLGPTRVVAKKVKDKNPVRREMRSARDEVELLDDLDNWERYADPDDLEYLYSNGVSKEALDEAFREIRYQNPTFASLDQALRSETINPEVETGGMFRELVERYITLLKECQSTPDDPGPVYEGLFFPHEDIDTEIFDDEPSRQDELRQRRSENLS